VTTGYVNALAITAGSVAAENITGTTITGKTIKSTSGNERIQMESYILTCYNSAGEKNGPQLTTAGEGINFFKANALIADMVSFNYKFMIRSLSGIDLDLYSTEDMYLTSDDLYIDSDKLGVFGVAPVVKQTAALLATPGSQSYTADGTYSSNEQDMLNALKTDVNNLQIKVNGVIEKLGLYGLFTVT
jgi:hypothetical protein